MAKKDYTYRGKTLEELKNLSLNELASLFPTRCPMRNNVKKRPVKAARVFLKRDDVKYVFKINIT